MKVLEIYSERGYDFSVVNYEKSWMTQEDVIQKCLESANGVFSYIDNEGYELFSARIKEFGSVDNKFIDWVKVNYTDYDMLKNRDFFVIEEEDVERV